MKLYTCPKCKGKWFIEYLTLMIDNVEGRRKEAEITWIECAQLYECKGCGLVVEDKGSCFKEIKAKKG